MTLKYSENSTWEHARKKLLSLPLLVTPMFQRITDRMVKGIPDVSYSLTLPHTAEEIAEVGYRLRDTYLSPQLSGWLELKVLGTPYVPGKTGIPWQTKEQPLFLSRWVRSGGRAGALLRDSADRWHYFAAEGSTDWYKEISGLKSILAPTRSVGPRPTALDLLHLIAGDVGEYVPQ